MTDAAAGGGAAGAGDAAAVAAAAAAAAAAAQGGGAGGGGSALGAAAEKPEEWLQEKYIVKDKEGKIDVLASSKATAKAHRELTTKMVETGSPPESPEKYELDLPKGFDVAEFRKDEGTATFLKGAHSLGLTNKQVNYVINKYLETAPQIAGAAAQLSAEEVMGELGKVWKTPQERLTNMREGLRASTTIAQSMGLTFADFEAAGLGNNPMFIRIATHLAKQMGEDGGFPVSGGIAPTDFDSQKKALEAELEKVPDYDRPGRQKILEKIGELYAKKFPGGRAAPVTA